MSITTETTVCIPGLEPIIRKSLTEIVIQEISDENGNPVKGGRATYRVVRKAG